MKAPALGTDLAQRFATRAPLYLLNEPGLKFELKPYLQPFEEVLALRELQALLSPTDHLSEQYGYYVADTAVPAETFRRKLTYWQRVGDDVLEPTTQKMLEFTQAGVSRTTSRDDLHTARRLRYGPHDLHDYRGKFFPQLVRSLMTIANAGEHAVVLDPMCGSGTTPCEVLASGRHALGADLNPLSVLISRVKASVVLEDASTFHDSLTRSLERCATAPSAALPWDKEDTDYLGRWFAPEALNDVAALLHAIRLLRRPLYRDFLLVCLSNILRPLSWQKDTDLRVRKEVTSYVTGSLRAAFQTDVLQQLDRITPYLHVLPRPVARPSLDIRHGDATKILKLFPEYRGRVDLLITSPPYATALPYLDTDRLSLIVLGLAPRSLHKDLEAGMVGTREVSESHRRRLWAEYLERRKELPPEVPALVDRLARTNHGEGVGFRRRNLPALLGTYFLAMLDAMRSARSMMTPKANAYYVVGNNSTLVGEEKLVIPTDDILFAMGARAGWQCNERLPMELLHSRDIFRANRGSAETILSFTA